MDTKKQYEANIICEMKIIKTHKNQQQTVEMPKEYANSFRNEMKRMQSNKTTIIISSVQFSFVYAKFGFENLPKIIFMPETNS